jgi:hypothetical protein
VAAGIDQNGVLEIEQKLLIIMDEDHQQNPGVGQPPARESQLQIGPGLVETDHGQRHQWTTTDAPQPQ